jgi:hypothetical protein
MTSLERTTRPLLRIRAETTRRNAPTPTPLPTLRSPSRALPAGISSLPQILHRTAGLATHFYKIPPGGNDSLPGAERDVEMMPKTPAAAPARDAADARLTACQERVPCKRSRKLGAAEGAGVASLERSGKRTDKALVEHGRSSLERGDAVSGSWKRDRPPKGQAGPAHRPCNLSGKADSEGISPPMVWAARPALERFR